MPKLPSVTARQLLRTLNRLGFIRHAASRGSHLVLVHADGRRAVIPVHARDIPAGTLMAIIKDLRLTKADFVELMRRK